MTARQRTILTRIITFYILVFLTLRLYNHVTASGLLQPPLSNGSLDITYWAFSIAGIFDFITGSKLHAVIFDCLLFSTGLLTLIFPLRRIFLIPFSILLFTLVLIYNNYNMHHNETMVGFALVLLAFWPADHEKSFLLWQGIRYFTCLIYPISVFWKAVYGHSLYYWPQGIASFKNNLVEYMFMNPGSFFTSCCQWFIRHPWILNAGAFFVYAIELIIIVGLFTRKFDKFLIWIPIFIHVSTYFFADVFYLELLVIDISFLSMYQVSKAGDKLPLLAAGS